MLKKAISWCHFCNSSKIVWSIEILGIEYVLFPTMLAFSLLKHVCLYFICYYFRSDQWWATVLFCTLLICAVRRGLFYLIDMACTLLWRINSVGFQSLHGCCKYWWTCVSKTFWVELSRVEVSMCQTNLPCEFPCFQRWLWQLATQPHSSVGSWSGSQEVARAVEGGWSCYSVVCLIVKSEEDWSTGLIANDCERTSSHCVTYSE